jgi:hypothetical protein
MKTFVVILFIGVHRFGFLTQFVEFIFLVSGLYMHYHNFCYTFSSYFPLTKLDLRCTTYYSVTRRPKAGTVESEQTFIAGQGLGKQINAATNTQETIE